MSQPRAYDDAHFLQLVSMVAKPTGKVTIAQVERAFWMVAWDLQEAILQQKPHDMETIRAAFRVSLLPHFVRQVEALGIEVVQ